MAERVSDPAPWLKISGIEPGDRRQRCHQDRAEARERRLAQGRIELLAPVAQLVGELDDQNAVLRREAHQHDEADLRVDVERVAGQPDAQQSAADGGRHAQHDDEGVDPAFELRRQHQEHHQDAEAEHEHDRGAGALVVQRLALVVERGFLGQYAPRDRPPSCPSATPSETPGFSVASTVMARTRL